MPTDVEIIQTSKQMSLNQIRNMTEGKEVNGQICKLFAFKSHSVILPFHAFSVNLDRFGSHECSDRRSFQSYSIIKRDGQAREI